MDEAAHGGRPLPLEHAHEHVEDVVAEKAAGVARLGGRNALRTERGHDLLDRQRRAVGDRAVHSDRHPGRDAVVVGRLGGVEVVGKALDRDAGPPVRLAEADDGIGLGVVNRGAQRVCGTRVHDREHGRRELHLERRIRGERLDELLRRIDGSTAERLEAGDEHPGHVASSSTPAASSAAARLGCSSTRTTRPSRAVTIAA